ncbi:MAG TPA: PGPGW domain-containing protein [Terriglobia bacterium]|nr:PGPGW domain-containing protein [Terriglobia bacterium]
MTRRFKRLLGLAAGWSLVSLGVLGLLLPILPGLPFLLLGITVLSAEYVWARRLLQKLRDLFPSLTRRSDSAKARAGEWVRRIVPTGPDDSRR